MNSRGWLGVPVMLNSSAYLKATKSKRCIRYLYTNFLNFIHFGPDGAMSPDKEKSAAWFVPWIQLILFEYYCWSDCRLSLFKTFSDDVVVVIEFSSKVHAKHRKNHNFTVSTLYLRQVKITPTVAEVDTLRVLFSWWYTLRVYNYKYGLWLKYRNKSRIMYRYIGK